MRISDWSSDVCSSDLNSSPWPVQESLGGRPHGLQRHVRVRVSNGHLLPLQYRSPTSEPGQCIGLAASHPREDSVAFSSEDGRVGKEGVSTCSFWWWLVN